MAWNKLRRKYVAQRHEKMQPGTLEILLPRPLPGGTRRVDVKAFPLFAGREGFCQPFAQYFRTGGNKNVESGIAMLGSSMIKSRHVDEWRREQGCSPSGIPPSTGAMTLRSRLKKAHPARANARPSHLSLASPTGTRGFPPPLPIGWSHANSVGLNADSAVNCALTDLGRRACQPCGELCCGNLMDDRSSISTSFPA